MMRDRTSFWLLVLTIGGAISIVVSNTANETYPIVELSETATVSGILNDTSNEKDVTDQGERMGNKTNAVTLKQTNQMEKHLALQGIKAIESAKNSGINIIARSQGIPKANNARSALEDQQHQQPQHQHQHQQYNPQQHETSRKGTLQLVVNAHTTRPPHHYPTHPYPYYPHPTYHAKPEHHHHYYPNYQQYQQQQQQPGYPGYPGGYPGYPGGYPGFGGGFPGFGSGFGGGFGGFPGFGFPGFAGSFPLGIGFPFGFNQSFTGFEFFG